jgi:hypothetical protein
LIKVTIQKQFVEIPILIWVKLRINAWINGMMEEWKDGRMGGKKEYWNGGTVEEWKDGMVEDWNNGMVGKTGRRNTGILEEWNDGTAKERSPDGYLRRDLGDFEKYRKAILRNFSGIIEKHQMTFSNVVKVPPIPMAPLGRFVPKVITLAQMAGRSSSFWPS